MLISRKQVFYSPYSIKKTWPGLCLP